MLMSLARTLSCIRASRGPRSALRFSARSRPGRLLRPVPPSAPWPRPKPAPPPFLNRTARTVPPMTSCTASIGDSAIFFPRRPTPEPMPSKIRALETISGALTPMVACLLLATVLAPRSFAQAGLIKSEFIYETAPFPSCHASTIVETKDVLVAAWFGGTAERNPDVGIWASRFESNHWTAPVEAANGSGFAANRFPTWNPVLFQPKTGPLILFYKVGPSPSKWWGMLKTSADHGKTWSEARRLHDGILGPIKNKPVQLANGDILCPSSTEQYGWRVHFERTAVVGQYWETTAAAIDGRGI